MEHNHGILKWNTTKNPVFKKVPDYQYTRKTKKPGNKLNKIREEIYRIFYSHFHLKKKKKDFLSKSSKEFLQCQKY